MKSNLILLLLIHQVALLQSKVVEMTKSGGMAEALAATEAKIVKVFREEREKTVKSGGVGGVGADCGKKMDVIGTKIDKLAKNLARVKYLVDATDEDSDGGGDRLVSRVKKGEGADGGKLEKFESILSAMESRQVLSLDELKKYVCDVRKKIDGVAEGMSLVSTSLEEDLTGTGDTLADILKKMEDVATKDALDHVLRDVGGRVDKVAAGLAEIPNEFGAQAAALEENLCGEFFNF